MFCEFGFVLLFWWRMLDGGEGGIEVEVLRQSDGFLVMSFLLRAGLFEDVRDCVEDTEGYGTHSFRIGAASEANARGWGTKAIKELGRWSSNCYKGYERRLEGVSYED
mgnify:CR=1 FL=1